ncbi:MAG TPA: long-chain fatty acid--CoA ligase [Candidatus Thermoplasmatota archaeon]|nr:long-chain fatty acid--CoA ligase [Candidatus Thermoplasmatota archaeon]
MVVEGGTLPEQFQASLARNPDAPALAARSAAGGWDRWTYRELGEAVACLACGLLEAGVGRGDRVAILGPNSMAWHVADQAALHIGAVTVPLYDTVPPAEQAFVLADSGAKVLLVHDAARWARLEPRRVEFPGLVLVAVLEPSTSMLSLPALTASGRAAHEKDSGLFARAWKSVTPADVATLIYTSGTTGRPKGVVLTHGNLAFNVATVSTIEPVGPGDVTVSFLPLSHSLQRVAELTFLANGVAIHHARSFESLPQDLLDVRPTILVGVPRVWEKAYRAVVARVEQEPAWKQRVFRATLAAGLEVVRAGDDRRPARLKDRALAAFGRRVVFRPLRERFGGRLRWLVSGGAPLSPDIERFFLAAGIPLLQGYGLTEAAPILTLNFPDDHRTGTVGKPMRGVEVRVAEDGEILGRGPGIARGYWDRPRDTSETFDAEGWLHTGDLGSFDELGFLHVTGRKKELIVKSNGKKLAPEPVEKRLESEPEIHQAVLLGEGRSYCAALVVPNAAAFGGRPPAELADDPEVRVRVDAALKRVNDGLAHHEQVYRVALLDRELTVEGGELTPSLKVKRRVVAERFAKEIERLFS